LLASIFSLGLEKNSSLEFALTGQISYPHTLFSGVEQLPPGSKVTVSGESVSCRQYWSPPEPDDSMRQSDVQECLVAGVDFVLDRLSQGSDTPLAVAMSAGLDSRLLLGRLSALSNCRTEGVCLTAAKNLEAWASESVCERLGAGFRHAIRRNDHYGRVYAASAEGCDAHHDWKDAHFFDFALGDELKERPIVGGYMADTLFCEGDPFFQKRQAWLRRKEPEAAARVPSWASADTYRHVNQACSDQIEQRWLDALSLLGLGSQHSENLKNVYPASRQGNFGHWDCARRFYCMHEVFMSRYFLELGFRIPAALKRKWGKEGFYEPFVKDLSGIPVNPDSQPFYIELKRHIKESVPSSLWPEFVKFPGPWSQRETDYWRFVLRRAEFARVWVCEFFGFESSMARALDPKRSLQIKLLVEDSVAAVQNAPLAESWQSVD
jgi:hypothetical protein